MDVKTGFFYLFSVVLLYAAFRVISARNPVHAVLHLMLAFSQASGLWLLLKAEFLATNDKLIKRAWYRDYKPALGVERPHEIYIEDSLKKEQYTRMLYSDVRLEAVPEAYFQKEYLLRLR